jgi:hypothetical protein
MKVLINKIMILNLIKTKNIIIRRIGKKKILNNHKIIITKNIKKIIML